MDFSSVLTFLYLTNLELNFDVNTAATYDMIKKCNLNANHV